MNALLALEDGTIFRGEFFGAPVESSGEICFNTSMTGYQEILTDPSYRGQIVTMTYPLIGNYGVNELDVESNTPQVRGFVIEELSPVASSWRANTPLGDWMKKHGITGIQGIDTRALTKRLRTSGAMRASIVPASVGEEAAVAKARSASYEGVDFVQEVTLDKAKDWDAEGKLSGTWAPASLQFEGHVKDPDGNFFRPVADPVRRIVAYDFGVKTNILRLLRFHGFAVHVVPARTPAADVLALNPDGVFLSNGPGDPEALDYAHEAVRQIVGKKPIFGICLGHQVLALALGGKTFKLKFGHRGANQPVQDLRTGKVAITSQNHGYAVDPDSLPSDVEVTHINLNDGTVAGLRHKSQPAFSVQYHPEASPGPHDAGEFFGEFAKEIDARLKKG